MSDEERANNKEFWSDDLPRPLIANVMPGEVERAPCCPIAILCAGQKNPACANQSSQQRHTAHVLDHRSALHVLPNEVGARKVP